MNKILKTKLNYQHEHQDQDQIDSDDQHQQGQHAIKQAHGLLLTISWFALLQLGIWSHYFRHYRYSILIHIISMLLIVILSVIAIVMMITAQGKQVIWQSLYHQTIGFIIVVGLVPITVIKGGIAKVLMGLYGVQTPWVVMMKQGHRIFGWIVVGLVQVPLMTGWAQDGFGVAGFIVLIDIGSYCLYWYLKLKRTKLQQIVLNKTYTNLPASSPTITSLSQYNRLYSGQHFIFANYLYKLQPVLNNHPGGQLLIHYIRNREVDQYLYGTNMIQKYNRQKVEPFSHSSACLHLAGQPVGRIRIGEAFLGLQEVNPCSVEYIEVNQGNGQGMAVVYVRVEDVGERVVEGYRMVNQLGRYRALCIDGTTRLYSNVQFLRPSNVRKMNLIMGSNAHQKYKKLPKNQPTTTTQIQLQQKLIPTNPTTTQTPDTYIPLYIKKYQLGKLTSKLPTNIGNKNCIISQSRGFGLGLDIHDELYGDGVQRMVFIAGGTGLNPYCDVIDLLYKEMLVDQRLEGWENLQIGNPILQTRFSKNYKFILYIAIDSLSYIHPITLYQIQQLTKNNLLQCHIKIKSGIDMMIQLQQINLLQLTYRFETIVDKENNIDKKCKFCVCGPNQMVEAVVGRFRGLGVGVDRYRVL